MISEAIIEMEYMSAQDAAQKWGITKRRVQILCASNRIDNAVRVGNMWLLPVTAEKPVDGRIREKKTNDVKITKNPIRLARNNIKAITIQGIHKLLITGISYNEAKILFVSLFASELLSFYITKSGCSEQLLRINQSLEKITEHSINEDKTTEEIRESIQAFIKKNIFCCDDALSWCYQYANKIEPDAKYNNTQFFTEKYMITSIVDSIHIQFRKKILDPACGGGNFLLYCLDILADTFSTNFENKECIKNKLQSVLSKLNGYEIDRTLAVVASINLRLKCLALLTDAGCKVNIDDFESFSPNVFYPMETVVAGALEIIKSNTMLAKVGVPFVFESKQVFANVDVIVTNPPFQTIKGMPENLKDYLKAEYPNSKCDMCNAFIELSYELIEKDGIVGLVTQNSWMYLDSFVELRKTILSTCTIDQIWELGSNAFYDLSGEKSNVALLLYRKTLPGSKNSVRLTSLKTMELAAKENLLSSQEDDRMYTQTIMQCEIYKNEGSRFDMISSMGLRKLLLSSKRYEEFAVPMQGTSTGNAKKLIDFYWHHINDKEWILVSKGGGYSRWIGLNHYCVKWGKAGEYIKATKGSAIRNVNYFNQTQLVFSDTGTSGLNVRELLPNQIFVASGPGIRIKSGKINSHLALLNSRLAAYYIRLLSPKLTIAAGYIAKLPVHADILESALLEEYGIRCVEVKRHRLSKRPCNIEFSPVHPSEDFNYEKEAYHWFLEDIEDEWVQLQLENKIDEYIFSYMGLSEDDISVIDSFIGSKKVLSSDCSEKISHQALTDALKKNLDSNCTVFRTKVDKRSLGCDGILEFLSQKYNVSCELIHKFIFEEKFYPTFLKEQYEGLYLHAMIMSALGYPYKMISLSLQELTQQLGITQKVQMEMIKTWIRTKFNHIHFDAMLKSPIFEYNQNIDAIVCRKETNG